MKYSGIGGQAVMEGVMMRNGNQYAVAVRKPDKEITVDVKNTKNINARKKKFIKWFFLKRQKNGRLRIRFFSFPETGFRLLFCQHFEIQGHLIEVLVQVHHSGVVAQFLDMVFLDDDFLAVDIDIVLFFQGLSHCDIGNRTEDSAFF